MVPQLTGWKWILPNICSGRDCCTFFWFFSYFDNFKSYSAILDVIPRVTLNDLNLQNFLLGFLEAVYAVVSKTKRNSRYWQKLKTGSGGIPLLTGQLSPLEAKCAYGVGHLSRVKTHVICSPFFTDEWATVTACRYMETNFIGDLRGMGLSWGASLKGFKKWLTPRTTWLW